MNTSERPWGRCGSLLVAGLAVAIASSPHRSPAGEPAAAGHPASDQPAVEPPTENGWVAEMLREFRTAGDALEWSDHRVQHDWRLQRRADGERWRLLGPQERVVTEGSRSRCTADFERLVHEGTIPLVRGPAVLVLHGLGQSRQSMEPLAAHLRRRLDATVMTVGYASPRAKIDDHASALGEVVDQLATTTSIDFIGHSLGNLVIRRWMATAGGDRLARVRRMVMLGPPNQGSELARMAARVWFLAMLADGATRQLGLGWPEVAAGLAVPPCDFGIVAGGTGDARGMSLLLDGDDDAVVRVDETRLAGATDFLLLPVHHADMMKDVAVQQATVCFLQHGRFSEPKAAVPAAPRQEPAR